MFELVDNDPPSPQRMPPPSFYRMLFEGDLNGYLFIIAFGGLVLGESLRAPRVVQIVVWLVAAGAGWWFFYRYFRQIEAVWRSDPVRRTRIVVSSVLFLVALLGLVFAVAIHSETTMKVISGIGWAVMLVTTGVQYLRQRRRESP